jgi:hypothetical protein
LVSLPFSGLIAIVRSQGTRLSGFCEWKTVDSTADADLIAIAERELGAFIRAVMELFGPERARLAAEDWVDELELMDALPGPTEHDWASVTVAASARLARRLNTDANCKTRRVD